MTTSKAQIRATNKYMAKAYDSLRIVVPRGRKADIEQYAQDHGESINGLVGRLLQRELSMTDQQWKARADDCTPETATPAGDMEQSDSV